MTEYVTCPFCKHFALVIYQRTPCLLTKAHCDFCGMDFPQQASLEAMLAVIAGTHYDGPEVV